jgi:hypothetical protein
MHEPEKWMAAVRDVLGDCFQQMRFARVTDLAGAGRYLEAEALLSPRGHVPANPRDLDLLARIAARQKRYSQARRLWEAARRAEPGNPVYADALRELDRAQETPNWRRTVAIGGLAAIVLAVLVAATVTWWPSRKARATVAPTTHRQPAAHESPPAEPAVTPIIYPRPPAPDHKPQ